MKPVKKVSKKETSYSLFLVPGDSAQVRKLHLSPRSLRLLVSVGVVTFFFFVFNVVGFVYYRTLYSSLEQNRIAMESYEQEKKDLESKVSLLEGTVNESEKLVSKLAGLVGVDRVPLQKGVGPIPPVKFDVPARTESVSAKGLIPHVESLQTRAISLETKIRELSKVQEDKLIYMASTPSIWPVKGWVTSDFGYRRSPFTLAPDFHSGLDIAASWGTPVIAPADGVVTFSGYKGGFGNLVVIDHGFGVTTRYAHTSKNLIQEGQKVKRGLQIALVGNTGHSTGPHLHFEIHVDGVPVDPMTYLAK